MTLSKDLTAGGGGSGAGGTASGDGNQDPNNQSPGDAGGKPEHVAYETHQRLLNQRKKDQEELKTALTRLAELENADKGRLEADLKKRGEYEKIVQDREKKIAELTNQLNATNQIVVEGVKRQALIDSLPGKVLNPAYLQFANLAAIKMDEEGNLDRSSLLEVANAFVKDHGHLIEKKNGAVLPNGMGGAHGKLAYADWVKLSVSEQKKRFNEVDWSKA